MTVIDIVALRRSLHGGMTREPGNALANASDVQLVAEAVKGSDIAVRGEQASARRGFFQHSGR